MLIKKSKGIINETNKTDLGNFDYYNKKLSFNSSSCNKVNGCELFIGIFVYDYQFDDFSIFLKNSNSNVKILPNEFVFGTLTSENENVSYNINIPILTSELNFIFENDNCKLSISKNDSSEVKYTCYREFCKISDSVNDILTFNIISQMKNSFYSLKINYPSSNQIITSERNEYCYTTDTNKNCYFKIPIREYENITDISFYLINFDYPKSFNPSLYINQTDITIANSQDINKFNYL